MYDVDLRRLYAKIDPHEGMWGSGVGVVSVNGGHRHVLNLQVVNTPCLHDPCTR